MPSLALGKASGDKVISSKMKDTAQSAVTGSVYQALPTGWMPHPLGWRYVAPGSGMGSQKDIIRPSETSTGLLIAVSGSSLKVTDPISPRPLDDQDTV